MMDFISTPLIVGIVCLSVYGLFELFVRREERLAIIHKIDENTDASAFERRLKTPVYSSRFSFGSLKAGCLLTGIGLGVLVGFLLCTSLCVSDLHANRWCADELIDMVCGASVLLFGGMGLIVAFVIELKWSKGKSNSFSGNSMTGSGI